LRESLIPRGRDELLKLQRLRIEDLKSKGFSTDGDDQFSPWDLEYYKRMMSLEKNSDEGKISQYFPLGPAVVGMLRIFESFLRLRFLSIPSNELDAHSIWHEDVQLWEAGTKRVTNSLGFSTSTCCGARTSIGDRRMSTCNA
jgi:Zn-dependent oligopeptidase